ncbi:MAG: M28 family peptidase [Flavobacteriales bacterium]|nr:M28 family peptidase [Flavobacteriales bacterium]
MLRVGISIFCLVFLANLSKVLAQSNTAEPSPTEAESDWAQYYAKEITAEELKEHLMILASDEYEGRETGFPGQKRAADYIQNYFSELGVAPCVDGSYYQTYPLRRIDQSKAALRLNGKDLEYIQDYYFFPGFSLDELKAGEIVLAGYGISHEDWNDYKDLDVKDKVVLVLPGEPKDKEGNYILGVGPDQTSEWSGDFRVKREAAMKAGAKALIMINTDYNSYIGRIKNFLLNPPMRLDMEREERQDVLPVLFFPSNAANDLLAKTKLKSLEKWEKRMFKKQRSFSATLDIDIQFEMNAINEALTAENVLCFIEGSDPELKDEIVVITAHYDHVGIINGEIHNGADDDGSGTVAALEIAESFVKAKQDGHGPRRSVLIMTVSGEEKGLLGSEWYADHPVFPLENTIVDLNIDMIGRVDPAHEADSNYVYLIGSDRLSTELHEISEKCNGEYTELDLDYTFNAEDDPNRFYYRSDHYNFAKNGIPCIFYFSGVHEDYHKPTDTPEKIMYEKTAVITRLVFHTAWQIANQDKTIEVDVTER